MIRKDWIECNVLPKGVTWEEVEKVASLARLFKQLNQQTGKEEQVVLSDVQKLIFYSIVNRYPRYNHVMCITRYGKSYVVSLAVIVRLITNPNEKWMIVAPTNAQASIIMNNIIDHLFDNEVFLSYLPTDFKDKRERMKHERSKERITFSNGSEIRILSADADNKVGWGKSLMWFGAGSIILDESCLIDNNIYSKIVRMLWDTNAPYLLEIGNPFYKNHFADSYNDDKYYKIVADADVALTEWRLTEEQNEIMKKLPNYWVMYKCEFPDSSELDSEWFMPLFTEQQVVANRVDSAAHIWRKVLWLDVSYSGNDANCWVVRSNNYMEVIAKDHSRSAMDIVGKTIEIVKQEWISWSDVYMDATGGGKPIYDRFVELGYQDINGVIFGEQPLNTEAYRDAKTEGYFKLYDWIAKWGKLSNENDWNQLTNIKYKLTSTSKAYIISKEDLRKRGIRSPDAADAAALTCMRGASDIYVQNPEKKKRRDEIMAKKNKFN